ncbi:unnamed protein product, partial [Laminaria digitata]
FVQNSNLVLTADRDSRRRGEEGTGEVESLHGRMKGQKMGDRLDKGSKPELEERKKKSLQKRERKATGEEQERKRSRAQRVFVAGKGSTVLTETEELDSINYRPKTKQSRWVGGWLGV